jgi:hypothetical protein
VTPEPVPTWARVTALIAAILTALAVVPTVVVSAVTLASTVAQIKRTTSFEVGPTPRLQVDARFGSVAIVAASDGRIVVVDQRAAGSITRANAAAAIHQMAVDVSRQGDVVLVHQAGPLFVAPVIQRNSIITIQVPAHTDVDVGNVGDLRIQGIDGTVHFQGSGSAELRDVTLRGASTLDAPIGQVRMTNVTVAGSTVVTKVVGEVTFDGQLAPGGSSLDIEANAGNVAVTLPGPTDARAAITTQLGDFRTDGTWLFTPDQVANPRRWTADLGPNPTGTVTVRTTLGRVVFASH